MILKVLLVLAVIGIVYFMFIKKKPLKKSTPSKSTKKDTQEESNDMVECSTCGIYTELNETIISSNKYYCSNECIEKA